MSSELPWFPLYVDEFLGDEAVKVASNRALGAYVKLLCHQWTHRSIPGNLAQLAKIVGESERVFEAVWAEIKHKFRTRRDRFVNPKLEAVRRQQVARRAALSQAGRQAHARPQPRLGDAEPVRSRSRSKTTTTYTVEFEEAWALYPQREGGNSKRAAWRQWVKRLSEGVSPAAMLAGTRRYAAEIRRIGKDGTEFVKQAATFYGRDRHFEYEEPSPAKPAPPPVKTVEVRDGSRTRLQVVPDATREILGGL